MSVGEKAPMTVEVSAHMFWPEACWTRWKRGSECRACIDKVVSEDVERFVSEGKVVVVVAVVGPRCEMRLDRGEAVAMPIKGRECKPGLRGEG
eukprot:2338557-Rhodomonas_salina.1